MKPDPRPKLAEEGTALALLLCRLAGVPAPDFGVEPGRWRYGACGFYRPGRARLSVAACARPAGEAMSRQWSHPGYSVDRTPYGVTIHELGHHFDHELSGGGRRLRDDFSRAFVREMRLVPITGYAPNSAEIFAEVFKLFGTNPDLLARMRPRAFDGLLKVAKRATELGFREVLAGLGAPLRIVRAAERKAGER